MVEGSVSQTFLLADLFWFRKPATDPHILAHVNTGVRMIGVENKELTSQN